MNEPQQPLNIKHILFCLSILSCLIVGLMSVLFALMAGTESEYNSAGLNLIAASLSFGGAMFACLWLIKE